MNIPSSRKAIAGAVLGLVVVLPAGAVEGPKQSIALWGFSPSGAPGGFTKSIILDFDPSKPGLEMLAVGWSCSQSAPDASGKVTVTQNMRFRIFNTDGTQGVAFAPIAVTSGAFPRGPAPGTYNPVQGPVWYYRSPGEMNSYLTYVDSGCDSFPITNRLGVGIATGTSSSRVAIFSWAMLGAYWSQADGGVDISKYTLTAKNANGGPLDNGKVTVPVGGTMWSKTFSREDSTLGDLDPAFSAVGDFLGNDSVDEVRLVWNKDVSNGTQYTYKYYNVLTGAFVSQKQFVVSNP